ncbi:MAG: thiamine phosphate synthase, partial [Victivallaceae bacterium]|nr:thiamine phosphate synthase [Victivallaceae bacterium]
MILSCFAGHAERAAAFDRTDVYPVISSEFTLGRSPVEIFEAVAYGGAKIVQLREKKRSSRELFELACACRPIANRYRVLLIIDDRLDVALAAGADGVHLGQDDLPVAEAKRIAPELWVGHSTHNLAEALAGRAAGADYINIGPVFPTNTKSVGYPALGLDMLRSIAPQVGMPFTVMGGIKAHHFAELIAAGARRIAMV